MRRAEFIADDINNKNQMSIPYIIEPTLKPSSNQLTSGWPPTLTKHRGTRPELKTIRKRLHTVVPMRMTQTDRRAHGCSTDCHVCNGLLNGDSAIVRVDVNLTCTPNNMERSNNEYVNGYDSSKPTTYILYLDANNLYGWAMIQDLPTGDSKKQNPTQAYTELNTSLLDACMVGDVVRVRNILSYGQANINSRGNTRMTPVMHAAYGGHEEVFDLLVREGAKLSLFNNAGENILHLACIGGSVEIVKYVLTQNIVGINSQDVDGWTPVMQAAKDGHKDVFDVLVEAGADLTQVRRNKETILHLASGGGNVEIIKHLLSHVSVDIDSRDVDFWTPVMHAVHAGDMDVFNFLVEKGADLSKVGIEKKNILHVACAGENVEIIKNLLKHDIVDIDSRDKDGLTPVMYTAKDGCKDVFDVLVKWGADLSLLDDDNDNILHLACGGNSIEIVKYLLKHNIVDINSRDRKEYTPAMIAACEGHEAVFFLLVDHEADLTIMNDVGDNILDIACKGGNVHIVKYVSTRFIFEGPYREDDPC
ncbi:ankyrin repeat domain-containing protein 17-like [Haliotis rubra]|uniref:ankyrin repeat domain-containing protein 17-like n=1 Tax=Haliotis rubra TaxID=36100 RepID=UPI001EE5168F|nr:ankyrin repeat domain-containing protein 17-like [Haliotis rubra]